MTGSRLRDIVVAGAGLALCWPVMAAVAIAVAVTDGRPVLFRQSRSGKDGRVFRLTKFRTMTSARDGEGRLLGDRQRITRLGRALRASRLDELPQLWNVLVGDMSLVGPRPLLPETVAQAGAAGQWRGKVRPGLTGWAQIHGNALLADADKIALDGWYVANRGFALDLTILARTVLVVVLGEKIDASAIGRAHACSLDRRG